MQQDTPMLTDTNFPPLSQGSPRPSSPLPRPPSPPRDLRERIRLNAVATREEQEARKRQRGGSDPDSRASTGAGKKPRPEPQPLATTASQHQRGHQQTEPQASAPTQLPMAATPAQPQDDPAPTPVNVSAPPLRTPAPQNAQDLLPPHPRHTPPVPAPAPLFVLHPRIEMTPPPTGGFLIPEGWYSDNVLWGRPMDEQFAARENPNGDTFLAYELPIRYSGSAADAIRMADVLNLVAPPGTRSLVTPGGTVDKIQNYAERYKPVTRVVRGIDPVVVRAILDVGVISTERLTFIALPLHPTIGSWLCRMRNLTYRPQDATEVVRLIQNKLVGDHSFVDFVKMNYDAVPGAPSMTEQQRLAYTIHTIRVEAETLTTPDGIDIVDWHVFMDSPTSVVADYRNLTDIIVNIAFNTPLNGWGRAERYDKNPCSYCRSAAHKVAACKLHLTPGWKGRPPMHNAQEALPSHPSTAFGDVRIADDPIPYNGPTYASRGARGSTPWGTRGGTRGYYRGGSRARTPFYG
ncbi:hypothetical protein K523DRAFT_225422 [Schizophyllum commune Tattone D]|nr:hypothetical protein K523DRAFT_225422 [Schizophyllum commune Tattone D]